MRGLLDGPGPVELEPVCESAMGGVGLPLDAVAGGLGVHEAGALGERAGLPAHGPEQLLVIDPEPPVAAAVLASDLQRQVTDDLEVDVGDAVPGLVGGRGDGQAAGAGG